MPRSIIGGLVGGAILAIVFALVELRRGKTPTFRGAMDVVLTFVVATAGSAIATGLFRMAGSAKHLQYSPQEWFVDAVVTGLVCVVLLELMFPSRSP